MQQDVTAQPSEGKMTGGQNHHVVEAPCDDILVAKDDSHDTKNVACVRTIKLVRGLIVKKHCHGKFCFSVPGEFKNASKHGILFQNFLSILT